MFNAIVNFGFILVFFIISLHIYFIFMIKLVFNRKRNNIKNIRAVMLYLYVLLFFRI